MPGQSGKTVIVTGANTGIGYETALAFYEKGAHVVLACRNADSAMQAMNRMQQQEGREAWKLYPWTWQTWSRYDVSQQHVYKAIKL